MAEFASVERAVEAMSAGRILIVVDSEDRENEGDFLVAAEAITPESIHFMVTHGRGHLCMPVAESVARRLRLEPIVPREDMSAPCFAVPIDARTCETGISPVDRALTIQTMLDPLSTSSDFLRPGHIFPLIAEEEGLLRRQGHTEAAIDLACMAEMAPAGVLCEICSRDGRTMARLPELMEMADRFDLPLVTIDDLLDHRTSMAARCDVEDSLAMDLHRLRG